VRVLSRLFKRKFLSYLSQAFGKGELSFGGKLKTLRQTSNWRSFLRSIDQTDWNVYAQPPFGGPKPVLKYLARYTHRVAISNQRLVSMEEGKIEFRWKNHRQDRRHDTMRLDGTEFIRRFLLHVLPKGFKHIRHFGFLANRVRKRKLNLCRKMLITRSEGEGSHATDASEILIKNHPCPLCKCGQMERDRKVMPDLSSARKVIHFLMFDTW
jgi:hypothetical protein